jgi:hypothetical protein
MGVAMVSDAQASAPVELPARVVVWSALLLRCIIRDREVDLSPQVVLPGTSVRHSGDQGVVVLPKWYVASLDLA